MSDERTGDDLLARATRALRDRSADADGAAAGDGAAPGPWRAMDGWSGVVRDLRRSARRRRFVVMGGLQVGLALAGLGAWAAASGRLPALFYDGAPEPSGAPAAPAPAPRHAARHAPASSVVAVAERAPPVAAPPAPSPPPVAERPAPPAPRHPRPATTTWVPPAPPLPASPPPPAALAPTPDALYHEAHRAHFVRRDYAAALAAWDRYLATGAATFRPEARYNRAIALIRLGRRAEASAALLPFATGEYGGYRADEARALLRMLNPPP